ncbi:MAG: type VII toxin-antitoxin system MntA family adenylyltransferase antitoxin [Gammaproteobacteria bacterium]
MQPDTPIFKELSRLLMEQPDILLATVFGSVAAGTAGVDSDLDVAVLADKPLAAIRKRQLIEMLAKASGRPVDLVDLRTAGVLLLHSALGGKRLVCRDNAIYASMLSRALFDGADFLPYHERLLRERRNAWIS